MKNKLSVIEHGNMMYYSRELVQIAVPKEINLIFFTITSLVICIILLLTVVKINDGVRVNGIIRTEKNNSTVKNVLAGEIEAIYFENEQYVEKGEVLYSLKKEFSKTVMSELENEILNVKEELYCVQVLLDGYSEERNVISAEENLFVYSKLKEYLETIDYLKKEISILKYKYQKEKNRPKALYNQSAVDEAFLNYELSSQELEKYKSAFLAELTQKKKNYELLLEKLEQELLRAKEEYTFLDVYSPISGFVQEVSSLNVGDYLFANQEVVVIVPDDAKNFRVELSVPTKDIGEITTGLKVKYRLSAFPFFEYKGAEGEINSIDSDVRRSSGNQLCYRVYSDIERTSFKSNKGIEYPLRAGIEVNARIVLEKKSVMHFILQKLDFMQ